MLSIRRRLFVCFLLMVLLPAIAFAAVVTVVGYHAGRQQVIDQLDSVATIKEAELDTWVDNLQAELGVLLLAIGPDESLRDILSPSTRLGASEEARGELRERLTAIVEQSQLIDAAFVMDLDSRVVLSSDPVQEGLIGAPGSNVYFQEGLKGQYLQPPSYSLSLGGYGVVAARPIMDGEGQPLGVLAAQAGLQTLSGIMLERTGLGQTGETYLVTRSRVMLTQPRFPKEAWSQTNYVFTEASSAALNGHVNGFGSYVNYRGDRVIGLYRWLPELRLALMAEQAEYEAMSLVYRTLAIYLAVTVVAVAVAAVVSSVLAGSIAHPLSELVHVATRAPRLCSASGPKHQSCATTARSWVRA